MSTYLWSVIDTFYSAHPFGAAAVTFGLCFSVFLFANILMGENNPE
jgi:hypothetical protein